jgi:hypothetical protein
MCPPLGVQLLALRAAIIHLACEETGEYPAQDEYPAEHDYRYHYVAKILHRSRIIPAGLEIAEHYRKKVE